MPKSKTIKAMKNPLKPFAVAIGRAVFAVGCSTERITDFYVRRTRTSQNKSTEMKGITMNKLILLAFVIGSGLFAGCASVPMTSSTLDSEAKNFNPEQGKVNIYIQRGGGMGLILVFQTVLDGRIAGSLAPDTFQLLSVSPGEHTVAVSGMENTQEQKLTAEAGKDYFYRVTVHMGWETGRAHIDPMSEDEGRKAVMSSKRAEATSYQ